MSIRTWGALSPSATTGLLSRNIWMSAEPIYVSTTGDDGDDGTYNAPLLTFSAAVTAAIDNGSSIIVLKSGFTETLTSKVTIANTETGLTIIGEGTGSSKARLINNVAAASTDCILSTGEGIRFENINFAVTTLGASVANAISMNVGGQIIDCDFGVNQYSGTLLESSGANYQTIRGCTFTGRATLDGGQVGIAASGGVGITIEDCTFDGNGYGKLIGVSDSGSSVTRIINAVLENNAHLVLATGTRGHVDATLGDGCSVDWAL